MCWTILDRFWGPFGGPFWEALADLHVKTRVNMHMHADLHVKTRINRRLLDILSAFVEDLYVKIRVSIYIYAVLHVKTHK